MAFSYREYKGLVWSCSDKIPLPHLFSAKLGAEGEAPYSAQRSEAWLQPERQKRIRENWLTLLEGAGLPRGICLTHQVHGDLVRTVGRADMVLPPLAELPADCDGLATGEKGVPLGVFTADCVPVLLCDAAAGAAAALHCGWKGTARDMIGSGVRALLALGAEPHRICAAIGPAISACCFETGPEVHEAMEQLLGSDAEGVWWPEEGVSGKFMVDLKEVNRRRLLQLGVKAENIDVSPDCTMCRPDLYWSHRYTKGVRGTQVSIIML